MLKLAKHGIRHEFHESEVDRLAKIVSDTWFAFAKTGKPNHSGLPNWPAYNEKDRATMIFDAECKVVSDLTQGGGIPHASIFRLNVQRHNI